MNRRKLITLLGSAAIGWPEAVAKLSGKVQWVQSHIAVAASGTTANH